MWIIMHFIVAHWLLINIVFHYFKAVFTSPGIPPQVILLLKKTVELKLNLLTLAFASLVFSLCLLHCFKTELNLSFLASNM